MYISFNLDCVEKLFSAISDIGIKENFALSLDTNTYNWKIPAALKGTISFPLRYTDSLKFPDSFEIGFGHITGSNQRNMSRCYPYHCEPKSFV